MSAVLFEALDWFVKDVEKTLKQSNLTYDEDFTYIVTSTELDAKDRKLVHISSPYFDEDEEIHVSLDVKYKFPSHPTLDLLDYIEIQATLYPYEKEFLDCDEIREYVDPEVFEKIQKWVKEAIDLVSTVAWNLRSDLLITGRLEILGYVDEEGGFYPLKGLQHTILTRESTGERVIIVDTIKDLTPLDPPESKTLVICPHCKEVIKFPAMISLQSDYTPSSLEEEDVYWDPSSVEDGELYCMKCDAELTLDDIYVYKDGKIVSFDSGKSLEDPDALAQLV